MSKSGDAPKVSGGIRQRLAKSGSLEVAAGPADSKPVSVPGPRKGIKQKLSESAPSRSESEVKVQKAQGTPLIDSLIHHWGKGKLTSQMALEFAFKAAQQGAEGIGKFNKNPSPANACRAMQSAIPGNPGRPPIDFITIPGPGGVMRPHPIICPMSAMEHMIQHDEKRFNEIIRGQVGEREAYWKGISQSPIFKRIGHHIDPSRHIALGLHGDGAPTSKTQGLFTISFNSLQFPFTFL